MVFNSIDFLIFFPIVVLIYFIIPAKARYIWLLVSSYYFYMSWNPQYAILIALSTVVTYICSILIDKNRNNKKVYLLINLFLNIGILIVFKYSNFIIDLTSSVLQHLHLGVINRRVDLLLPVGISFYTFQALGYSIDVYRGKIQPERNLLKYALFVSFFPQLVAGPIERSENLLPQIKNVDKIKVFNYRNIHSGLMLILWGLFQKLVIADRIALLVNNVVDNYGDYGFWEILIAIVLFAFQIYCDFGGYTNIARGSAMVMGIKLMNNFEQPYLATSIKDFWRRWHISLTSWFTDYLYIPLGGNRKGVLRKYINILIVFGVSGLWHGASVHFIIWGLIHAIYQIGEDLWNRQFMAKTVNIGFVRRILRIVITFMLADFAWLFFMSDSIHQAIGLLKQMAVCSYSVGIFDIGLDVNNWIVLIISILILFFVDVLHERGICIYSAFMAKAMWFKLIVYLVLVWSIIMLGIYGVAYDSSTFIYFQF